MKHLMETISKLLGPFTSIATQLHQEVSDLFAKDNLNSKIR